MTRTRLFGVTVLLALAAQATYQATTIQSAGAAALIADPASKGPYEVGHTSYVLMDPGRSADDFPGRPIAVYVWYPVDAETVNRSTAPAVYRLEPLFRPALTATSTELETYGIDGAYDRPAPSSRGPFPLVMVSPGWTNPGWIHTSLGTRLASHGFVVAAVSHLGDRFFSWEPPRDHIAIALVNRPRDVVFALTDLLQRTEAPGDLLFGTIRPDQIAASGWSLGGYAAITLAGGDDSVCDGVAVDPFTGLPPPPSTCVQTFPDSRIRAIVPLDGSNQLLKFQELARVTVPSMGIGQEWAGLAMRNPSMTSWQARAHAAFSGHPAYRVDVYNSVHPSFSDFCEATLLLRDKGLMAPDIAATRLGNFCTNVIPSSLAHELTTKYMIAFLKTHLAGERGYQHMLTPGWALTRETDIEFFVTEKRNARSIDEEWPGFFVYFPHQPGSWQARAEKDPAEPALLHVSLTDAR